MLLIGATGSKVPRLDLSTNVEAPPSPPVADLSSVSCPLARKKQEATGRCPPTLVLTDKGDLIVLDTDASRDKIDLEVAADSATLLIRLFGRGGISRIARV